MICLKTDLALNAHLENRFRDNPLTDSEVIFRDEKPISPTALIKLK